MDLGAILLILAVALLVGVFISRPFFDRRFETQPLLARQAERTDHQVSALLADKDRILNALADLDFDQAMGKASPEEYPAQRARLVLAGADVLRKLDALAAAQPAKPAPARPSAAGDEIEQLIAARRRELRERAGRPGADKSSGFCPKCGRPVAKEDRFCPKCGAAL